MAITVINLPAPPEFSFGVLEDPRSLAYFVVGSRTIRRFDPRWPELHTEVHHTVGIPPFVIRDTTEVTDVRPPHLLTLEARFRPIGVTVVEFRLSPHPEGTELTINEYPVRGPLALSLLAKLVDGLITLRNQESGRRLRKLVEARQAQQALAADDG
jgi:uncharacterized protein YndB with AHSA1/START domain